MMPEKYNIHLILNNKDLESTGFPARPGLVNHEREQFINSPSDYSFLKEFIQSLRKIICNADDKEFHYCYPRNDSNNEINSSDNAMKIYIDELVDRINSAGNAGSASFITGKMGSGKTTFINNILNNYYHYFFNDKISLCFIAHSDINLPDYLANNDGSARDDDYELFVRNRLRCEVLNSFSKNYGLKNCLGDDFNAFKSELLYAVGRHYDERIAKKDVYIFEEMIFNDIPVSNEMESISRESWDILCSLLKKHDAKILIIIDGLDVLNHSVIVDEGYDRLFSALYKFISFGTASPLAKIGRLSYLISLRNCTYDDFFAKKVDKTARKYNNWMRRNVLEPIPFVDLFKDAIDIYIRQSNKEFWKSRHDKIVNMFNEIFTSFSENYVENHGDNFAKYFEYNCREAIEVTINIFNYIVNTTLSGLSKREGGYNFDEIIDEVIKKANFLCKHRHYQIIETIIIGNCCGFVNRYAVKIGDFNRYTIDPTLNGGVIDNIFNYHLMISNTDTRCYFLIKVRLLQILIVRNGYIIIDDLIQYCKRFGYELDQRQMKHLLFMMIDSNFVKTRFDEHTKALSYNITEFGRFVVNDLIFSMSYIENTIQTSLIPTKLIDNNIISGIIKYKPLRGGERIHTSKYEWVKKCVIHCIITNSYINYIEENIEKPIFNSNNDGIFGKEYSDFSISNTMKGHLNRQIGNIFRNDADWLKGDGVGLGYRDISEDVMRYLEEIESRNLIKIEKV